MPFTVQANNNLKWLQQKRRKTNFICKFKPEQSYNQIRKSNFARNLSLNFTRCLRQMPYKLRTCSTPPPDTLMMCAVQQKDEEGN